MTPLEALATAVAVLGAFVLTATLLTYSAVRRYRRSRLRRAIWTTRAAIRSPRALRARHSLAALTAPADRRPGLLARRDLLVAVAAAEEAVGLAAAGRAPLGELPRLCRQLRAATGTEARVLAAAASYPAQRQSAAVRAAELTRLADEVRAAAFHALEQAGDPDRAALAHEISVEVAAVRAGADRARL